MEGSYQLSAMSPSTACSISSANSVSGTLRIRSSSDVSRMFSAARNGALISRNGNDNSLPNICVSLREV